MNLSQQFFRYYMASYVFIQCILNFRHRQKQAYTSCLFPSGTNIFFTPFFSEILALLVDIKIILERGVRDGNQHETKFITHNPTFSISRSRSSSEITTGLDFDVFNSRGYTISMGAVSTPLNDLLNFLAGVTAGVLRALI